MISVLISAALSINGPQITEFQRDPIGVYDSDGALVRKAPKSSLPKPPFPVTAEPDDFFSIQLDGQKLYFRGADVEIVGRPAACTTIAQAPKSASQSALSNQVGSGSNMGFATVPCIPTAH